MKTVLIYIAGAFIVGLTAGWVGGAYQQARSFQEAVRLFKAIELDNAEKRAKEAYAKEPAVVGIWELKYVIDLLEEARQARYEGSKSLQLKCFLTHARLARLYQMEGNQDEAQKHFRKAVRFYNDDHPNAKIDDFQVMLERLDKFDEIAKTESKP